MNFCSQLSQSLFGSQSRLESQSQHSQGAFSQLTHGQRLHDQPSQQSEQSQPLVLDPKHLPKTSLSTALTKHRHHVQSSANKRSGQSLSGYNYTGGESSSWKFFKTYNESPLVVSEQTDNSQTTMKGGGVRDGKEWATCKELSGLGAAMRDLYQHIDKLNGIPELKNSLDSLMKKAETSSDTRDVMCSLREMSDHMNLQSKMIESLLEEQSRPQTERREAASCSQVSSSCQTSPNLLTGLQTLTAVSSQNCAAACHSKSAAETGVEGKGDVTDVSTDQYSSQTNLQKAPEIRLSSSKYHLRSSVKKETSNRKQSTCEVRRRNKDRVHKHRSGSCRSPPSRTKVESRARHSRHGCRSQPEELSTSVIDSSDITNLTSAVLTENDLTPLTFSYLSSTPSPVTRRDTRGQARKPVSDCSSTTATPTPVKKKHRHGRCRKLTRKVTFSPGAKSKHLLVKRKHRHASCSKNKDSSKRCHSSSCHGHKKKGSERSRSESRPHSDGPGHHRRSHTTSREHGFHSNVRLPEMSQGKVESRRVEQKHRHKRSAESGQKKVYRRTVSGSNMHHRSRKEDKTTPAVIKKPAENEEELLLSMSAFDNLFDED